MHERVSNAENLLEAAFRDRLQWVDSKVDVAGAQPERNQPLVPVSAVRVLGGDVSRH